MLWPRGVCMKHDSISSPITAAASSWCCITAWMIAIGSDGPPVAVVLQVQAFALQHGCCSATLLMLGSSTYNASRVHTFQTSLATDGGHARDNTSSSPTTDAAASSQGYMSAW